MIEPMSLGVLDSRMRGNDSRVWRHTIHVIASEAKQSILATQRKNGLLRRFAPRNDGGFGVIPGRGFPERGLMI